MVRTGNQQDRERMDGWDTEQGSKVTRNRRDRTRKGLG